MGQRSRARNASDTPGEQHVSRAASSRVMPYQVGRATPLPGVLDNACFGGRLSLRVFGRLPVTGQGVSRRQASEKPRGRKPRGEFAPTLVSIYGEFAGAA